MIILNIILYVVAALAGTRAMALINYVFTKKHGRRVLDRVKYLSVTASEVFSLFIVSAITVTLFEANFDILMMWAYVYFTRMMENIANLVPGEDSGGEKDDINKG